MLDSKTQELLKLRDEKILRNLNIARERSANFSENSLGYILAENKRRDNMIKNHERNEAARNRLLKELEGKLIGQDSLKK